MKAGMPFFVKQKKKQTRFCRKPKILQMRQSVISINMALPDLPFRKWKNSVPISGRKWLPMRKRAQREKILPSTIQRFQRSFVSVTA